MIENLKLEALLRGYHLPSIGQKLRTLADLLWLAGVAGYMVYSDAPGWAMALLFFVATRPSRLDSASDARAVQSTVADLRDSTEKLRLDFSAAIAKAEQEREEFKRSTRPPHKPPITRVPPGGRP